MKTFILKYKWQICFWVIYASIVFYFGPKQHDYYLDADIESFSKKHLVPVLIGTWIVIISLAVFYLLIQIKSFKRAVANAVIFFLTLSVISACSLYILKSVFLDASLFANRQYKKESVTKFYIVSYMVGVEENKDNFNPYDISTRHINFEKKLKEKLYHTGLKLNDTITLTFNKGIFGIAFQTQPFLSRR